MKAYRQRTRASNCHSIMWPVRPVKTADSVNNETSELASVGSRVFKWWRCRARLRCHPLIHTAGPLTRRLWRQTIGIYFLHTHIYLRSVPQCVNKQWWAHRQLPVPEIQSETIDSSQTALQISPTSNHSVQRLRSSAWTSSAPEICQVDRTDTKHPRKWCAESSK